MQANDIVQIRVWDGTAQWIYAKVLDPVTRQVLVQHPGNSQDGQVKIMAAADIRTKADVLALVPTAQSVSAAPLTDAQLSTLSASDAWIKIFTQQEHVKERATVHLKLVQHYTSQASQLS